MRINSRQVEAFRAVMLTGAMTAAAETLHITQPAVSRLIRDLEYVLDLTLFHRRGNQVVPTAEANDLLAEVERTFLGLDRLTAHAENLRNKRSGSLRIAAMPAMAIHFLPHFIADFCRNRPDVDIQLDGIPSHSVVERVAGGRYDIGVCMASAERSSVSFSSITASAVVVLPNGHRLTKCTAIRASDLVNESIIMLGSGSDLRHGVETALRSIQYRRMIVASLSTSACSLVLAGAGVTIVDPFSARDFLGRGVAIRPFKPSIDVGYRVVHSQHRPLSRLAKQFMEDLLAYVALFLSQKPTRRR
ncbi:LysR substrate-binding domain-containing protein [Bradyrhizobium sp. CCBAU 11361]|uniref:LysR substrate-binding domain-containing protein n=1 Tax=Bradyrhizobium sp. CCBAU 11361 TaxID=1630812 RepID=UPI0023034255|nr:LysR substrate-binding domain-containing protein [Bradyrhizobium sp. CCBAU 11361]